MTAEETTTARIQTLEPTRMVQGRMALRVMKMGMELYPLVTADEQRGGVEEVLVTLPIPEGDRVAWAQARALRIKEGVARDAKETERIKEILDEIASISQGFETGSENRLCGTGLVCAGLMDNSEEIRLHAAGKLNGWAEPIALQHLEKVWMRDENTQHLLRLRGTPTMDAAAALTTMRDIHRRFPDHPLTPQQQSIIEGKF